MSDGAHAQEAETPVVKASMVPAAASGGRVRARDRKPCQGNACTSPEREGGEGDTSGGADGVAPGAAPIIGSIVPWFGAKRTLGPIIVEELGPHRTYWEPFCGSLAVLLAKPRASMETVNDLHDDLINLARTLQNRQEGPRLYRKLRRVLMDAREHRDAAMRCRDELAPSQRHNVGINPGRALDFFLTSWFGRNGVAGTTSNLRGIANFNVRYTNRGGSATMRWKGAVASIPAFRRRLRDVTILASDGIELCERIADDAGTVIYADPPYLAKGAEYVHDFDWLAHRRLAKALRKFELARVVVSYYDHPDLAALYPGWTKREVHVTKALVNQGRRDGQVQAKAPEVLLINGPSLAKGEA